jgi:phosphatidylethanolamine/phosphatidyl-N-methylethanolamine N-methyltransferase
MDLTAIQKAYARWAPHYDISFGVISDWGRNFVVTEINRKPGHILEVGVGTGLSLPMYAPDMMVTGIDVSDIMLERARNRVADEKLRHVKMLENMDATQMYFADNSFDAVTAMYIMSVAPNPEAIMQEIARVVKSGGDVYILNHFSSRNKFLSVFERAFEPICRLIGWHSKFDMTRLLNNTELELVEVKKMRPFGLFDRLHFKKK